MKRLSLLLLAILGVSAGLAQDINPSRQTVPNQFINPPGRHFSIFSGDPERVQKANEINFNDFKGELSITPQSVSKTQPTASQTTLKIDFSITNISKKKGYTLSFPDAQRYDIAISQGKNHQIYLWSADKIFEQKVGSSYLNPGESLSWTENIPISTIVKKANAGTYDVKVILANYPEISSTVKLTIKP